MTSFVVGCLSLLFYVVYVGIQIKALKSQPTARSNRVVLLATPAILAHLVYVSFILTGTNGIVLTALNLLTLVMLVVTTLAVFVCIREQNSALMLVVTPVASILLVMSLLAERSEAGVIDQSTGFLIHISTSILAYSILALAAFQALVLFGLERWLKSHETNFLLRILPALETVETSIHLLLRLGLGCLSLAVLTGILFLWTRLDDLNNLLHILFAMASLVVYSVLVSGHLAFGWRGKVTARYSLMAFILLLAGYFGLKPIIEILS